MMNDVFGQESEGMLLSQKTHETALNSYREFVSPLSYLNRGNLDMSLMASNSLERHLETNRRYLKAFRPSSVERESVLKLA